MTAQIRLTGPMVRLKKSKGPLIDEIDWNPELTWKLLGEAEKDENRKTLLGKKKDEVSFMPSQCITMLKKCTITGRIRRRTLKLLSSSTLDLSSLPTHMPSILMQLVTELKNGLTSM